MHAGVTGVVFDAAWFRRHARSLRMALNTPGLGSELRAALGVQPRGRVVALLPHASIVQHGRVRVADVRTHAKHAKRLHDHFLPLWTLFHWFDARIANPFVPAFNLGFDTLTISPDPSDPGVTTVDGMLQRGPVDEPWATITTSAGTNHASTETISRVAYMQASATVNQWKDLRRSIFLFDTSVLGASASISAAVLSLFANPGSRIDQNGTTPDIDIYLSTPAALTTLAHGDFSNIGSVSQTGAPISYAAWTDSVYNDFTLNATGRGNLNPSGVSKFGARNANFDAAGIAPTYGGTDFLSGFEASMADANGSTNDPKLVVTFTLPPGQPFITRLGARRLR